MPKDATKNIDRYKIRGGELNEYDFHQSQEDFSEQQRGRTSNLIPGRAAPPFSKGPTKSIKKKVTKTNSPTKKATKTETAAPRGATAKKLAARKAAKKK